MSDRARTDPLPAGAERVDTAWPGRLGAPLFLLIWVACLAGAIYANVEGARLQVEDFRYGSASLAGWQRAFLALWALAPLTLTLAALVLFWVRRRSAVAGLLSLALLTLSATQLMAGKFWSQAELVTPALVLDHLGWFACILALLIFPTGKFASRWGLGASVAAGVFLALDIVQVAPGNLLQNGHVLRTTHSYTLNAVILAGFFFFGAATLVGRFRASANDAQRQQILWVLAGLTIFIVMYLAWVILNLLPFDGLISAAPAYWGPIGGAAIALAFVGLGSGFMIALVRYRLYDADAVLGRSAVFAILSTLFGALFLLGEPGMHWLLRDLVHDEGSRKLVVAALALVVVTPLKTSAVEWADRLLRKPLTDLKEKLPTLLTDLRETASVPELLRQTAARIAPALRPKCLAFVIDDGPALLEGVDREVVADWLARLPASAEPAEYTTEDMLFPVRHALRIGDDRDDARIGWLLVGSRSDGESYRADERGALASAVPAIARAVRTSRHRETQEAKLDEILKMLKRRGR